MIKKLCFIAVALALAPISSALVTQVNTPADLGANDQIDWKQFGPDGTTINSGAHGFTTNGIGFQIISLHSDGTPDVGPAYEVETEGSTWHSGLFAPGTTILHHLFREDYRYYPPPRHTEILFATGISGFGMQMTPKSGSILYGGETWGTSGFQNWRGDVVYDNLDHSNPPTPYMAMVSDSLNIVDVNYTIDDFPFDDWGSVITNMGIRDHAAVPEPASMAALGLGIAALIRRRKNSR